MTRPLPAAAPFAALALLALVGGLCAAPSAQAQPVAPAAAAAAAGARASPADRLVVRAARLPSGGLFDGDRLSASAQQRLAALVEKAEDLDIEVLFVAPTGNWLSEGGGERSLTPARLAAVRDFLISRGVDRRRIYTESRIDPRAPEAQMAVELVGRPSPP